MKWVNIVFSLVLKKGFYLKISRRSFSPVQKPLRNCTATPPPLTTSNLPPKTRVLLVLVLLLHFLMILRYSSHNCSTRTRVLVRTRTYDP